MTWEPREGYPDFTKSVNKIKPSVLIKQDRWQDHSQTNGFISSRCSMFVQMGILT